MAKKTSIGFCEWHYRGLNSIAQGALTNSKRPECLVKGIYPTHLKQGSGSWVFDLNGKQYADWEQAFQNAIRDDWAGIRKAGL
jgi:glutamate-1-semialdehyde aminotransferase